MARKDLPDQNIGYENLIHLYDLADEIDIVEGQDAYNKYHKVMKMFSDEYALSMESVTAAFCALSPNSDYIGNLRSLRTTIEGVQAGLPNNEIIVSTYNHCKDRAIDHLLGDPFETKRRGLKILNFYRNILDPSCNESVTIDGHIAAGYYGDPNLNMKDIVLTRRQYPIIKEVLQNIANEKSMLMNQVQAIIWFSRKRNYKIKYVPVHNMFAKENDTWGILVDFQDIPIYKSK